MPLYEYYCSKCNSKFEMLRSMDRADEPISCPEGHPQARRLLSLIGKPSSGGAGFDESFDGEGTDRAGGCACGGNCSCG